MTYIQKKYITDEDIIIGVNAYMHIILLTFMSDIYIFSVMSNEGCFTFIITILYDL